MIWHTGNSRAKVAAGGCSAEQGSGGVRVIAVAPGWIGEILGTGEKVKQCEGECEDDGTGLSVVLTFHRSFVCIIVWLFKSRPHRPVPLVQMPHPDIWLCRPTKSPSSFAISPLFITTFIYSEPIHVSSTTLRSRIIQQPYLINMATNVDAIIAVLNTIFEYQLPSCLSFTECLNPCDASRHTNSLFPCFLRKLSLGRSSFAVH